MSTAAVIGSTGLVGSNILTTLIASPAFSTIQTISRRQTKATSPKLNAILEPDTTQWTTKLASLSPTPSTVFSALGTKRADAGGLAAQWKIDHDLNIELAREAKARGVKTFVFISSGGTRSMLASQLPYSKMKNGVEDAVKELGFENAVIVRPGMILGERETKKQPEAILYSIIYGMGRVLGNWAKDPVGQEAKDIARAAVAAARMVEEGKAPETFWVLEVPDILRLGRDEWKE
jgi:uncharacterized protein YbjT (DUF2867 family)